MFWTNLHRILTFGPPMDFAGLACSYQNLQSTHALLLQPFEVLWIACEHHGPPAYIPNELIRPSDWNSVGWSWACGTPSRPTCSTGSPSAAAVCIPWCFWGSICWRSQSWSSPGRSLPLLSNWSPRSPQSCASASGAHRSGTRCWHGRWIRSCNPTDGFQPPSVLHV